MGSNRFNPEKWPNFFAAAKQADYATMSQECHTKSVSENRNQMVANAFKGISNMKWYAYGTMHNKPRQNASIIRRSKTI